MRTLQLQKRPPTLTEAHVHEHQLRRPEPRFNASIGMTRNQGKPIPQGPVAVLIGAVSGAETEQPSSGGPSLGGQYLNNGTYEYAMQ